MVFDSRLQNSRLSAIAVKQAVERRTSAHATPGHTIVRTGASAVVNVATTRSREFHIAEEGATESANTLQTVTARNNEAITT